MLVLSREENESIVLDTDHGPIEIMVVDIRGDKVRIGITADRSVNIFRKELVEKEVE